VTNMKASLYAEKWERKHINCIGQYVGPYLPGFNWLPGEIIHVCEIPMAAATYRYAVMDQRDRVMVSA